MLQGWAVGQQEKAPAAIEVFYPVAVDAPIAAMLNGYVEKFQQENPRISVKPVFSGGYGDVKTAIQTTIQGGAKPPAWCVLPSWEKSAPNGLCSRQLPCW